MADQTRRDRVLTFLVLPAVMIAVAVLVVATVRNSLRLDQLREQAIVDATFRLADEKADRFDKRIIEQDNAARAALRGDSLEDFGVRWLGIAAQQTPTVRGALLLERDGSDREVVAFASRGEQREDERFRRLLLASLLGEFEVTEAAREQLRHLHTVRGGKSYLLSYWQERIDGRWYLIVLWHSVPLVIHDLFPTLYGGEDARQSWFNVTDSEGRIVFGVPLQRGQVTVGRNFQTTLYKWRANVVLSASAEHSATLARKKLFEVGSAAASLVVVVAGLIIIAASVIRERRLSNLKSEFVANVSHELKTPLALVRMFTELLLSGRAEEPERRKNYLEIINKEAERLTALIDNVLDFARIEQGRAAYQLVSVDMPALVLRAVSLCEGRATGVQWEVNLPELPFSVHGDERALEIAVVNLLDNGLKYGGSGGVLMVTLVRRGSHCELVVADRGPGIPPDLRKRVFERFYRVPGVNPQARGSGIGLAVVQHIVRGHRGQVYVEENPPRGSRFVVRLPVEAAGGDQRSSDQA